MKTIHFLKYLSVLSFLPPTEMWWNFYWRALEILVKTIVLLLLCFVLLWHFPFLSHWLWPVVHLKSFNLFVQPTVYIPFWASIYSSYLRMAQIYAYFLYTAHLLQLHVLNRLHQKGRHVPENPPPVLISSLTFSPFISSQAMAEYFKQKGL
jgi:hypothetical protein